MAIRLYRAYSPGTRFRSTLYFNDLTKKETRAQSNKR
jgi:hypothetical protein